MKKFRIVTVSKDSSFKTTAADLSGIENAVELVPIPDNSMSLAKIYNQQILEARKSQDVSFLMFIHGDAYVDVKTLIDKAVKLSSKYDVFGLCGTEVMRCSQSPLNWFTGSRQDLEKRWGCVTHCEKDVEQQTFYSSDRQDITDHEVVCIDGVCMILSEKAIQCKDLLFDEQFNFDQYDTDFCFQCAIKHKLKIGVIVEKSLKHFSVGKSILTDDFLMHELDFRKKWKLDVPKGSRLEQLASQKL